MKLPGSQFAEMAREAGIQPPNSTEDFNSEDQLSNFTRQVDPKDELDISPDETADTQTLNSTTDLISFANDEISPNLPDVNRKEE